MMVINNKVYGVTQGKNCYYNTVFYHEEHVEYDEHDNSVLFFIKNKIDIWENMNLR